MFPTGKHVLLKSGNFRICSWKSKALKKIWFDDNTSERFFNAIRILSARNFNKKYWCPLSRSVKAWLFCGMKSSSLLDSGSIRTTPIAIITVNKKQNKITILWYLVMKRACVSNRISTLSFINRHKRIQLIQIFWQQPQPLKQKNYKRSNSL